MRKEILMLCGLLALLTGFTVAQAIRPASAMGGGPYQLMQHSNQTANVGVFRLDTSSGGVSYCYITQTNDLTCTKEVR